MADKPPPYTLDQFLAMRTYQDISISPDGAWVAYLTNTSGQVQVWKQGLAQAGGQQPAMPFQLTAMKSGVEGRAIWAPDGSFLLTLATRPETGQVQIYRIPAEQGWAYPLLPNPEERHQLAEVPFRPGGEWLTYLSNARTSHEMDLVISHLLTGARHVLLQDAHHLQPISWSPDGQCLLLRRAEKDRTVQQLLLYDIATGATTPPTPHQEGEVVFTPGPWRQDGQGFYVLSDQQREWVGLGFFELATRSLRWLETPPWDIERLACSTDERYLVWVVNEAGISRLYVRDQVTQKTQAVPHLPLGVIHSKLALRPTLPQVVFTLCRPERPAEVYAVDLDTPGYRRLTQGFLGGIPEAAMTVPELIQYPTFDGRLIPAWPARPPAPAGEQVPVILWIHGGPSGQERPEYSFWGFHQYLLQRGMAMLAPNFRGSSGYGKTYQRMAYRDWGGDELRDLEAAVQYLRGCPWADTSRLAVMGPSYGGFATLACLTRFPTYWRAGVDFSGPANLNTYVATVSPDLREIVEDRVGHPERDAALLRERSPLHQLELVQAPVLIIHGTDDQVVARAEADQAVERLRALGKPVEYLLLEGEGHGLSTLDHQRQALETAAQWLERYLKDD